MFEHKDNTYPLKLLLFSAVEGALMKNAEDIEYLNSNDCKLDCKALNFDYDKLKEWIINRDKFITVSQIHEKFMASHHLIIDDIDSGKLPAIREIWQGNRWRYLVPENYIEYPRR